LGKKWFAFSKMDIGNLSILGRLKWKSMMSGMLSSKR
jgi:hypothetical protein